MASLNYATGGVGPYRNQIGWFDFGNGITLTAGTTFTFTNVIPNVGNVIFTVYNELGGGTNSSTSGSSGPLYGSGYTGIGGFKSIAYNSVLPTKIVFGNISVTDFNGNALNYQLMSGDSESTIVAGEYINWVTDGGAWTLLATVPNSATPTTAFSGDGTNSFTTTEIGGGTAVSPVISSLNPTSVTIGAISHNTEAIGLGFLIDAIGVNKTVSSGYAGVGNVLTYTIPVTNYSTTTLNSAFLIDTVPSGVTYNSGTLLIDGVASAQSFPTITLPVLSPGDTTTITYQVTVTSTIPNPIVNDAIADPGDPTISTIWDSVITTINFVGLDYSNGGLVKSVSETIGSIGDIITYTIVANNMGNVTASSVILQDTIPSGTTYVAGSLTGGTGAPDTGITVGTIAPGELKTITFKVTVTTIPVPNPIQNTASATYTYIPNPITGTSVASGGNTNTVDTSINYVTINSLTKTASQDFGTIGDTILYTLSFINSGNDTATNVTFIDTIPNGITFVPDSLTVDGVVLSGESPIPPIGTTIPDVGVGILTTITFKAIVTSIPTINPLKNQGKLSYTSSTITIPNEISSNIAVTTINTATISSAKYVDKAYASVGDVLTYSIALNYSGNTLANNVTLSDAIPANTEFVPNSVTLNGVSKPGASPEPPSGYNMGSINTNGLTTITFKVIITTNPNPSPIPNSANINYTFTIYPTLPNGKIENTATNIVLTTVVNADLSGITKWVDKTYANCGDVLNYTITLPNSGNVTAINVVLKDTIPNGIIFVDNSVSVNGVTQTGANPSSGINVGSIGAGESTVITFQGVVNC